MMAATSFTPVGVPSPEQAIQAHADAMSKIAKRLLEAATVAESEFRKRDSQLNDALDEIYTLKTQLREKDQIISELQDRAVQSAGKRGR